MSPSLSNESDPAFYSQSKLATLRMHSTLSSTILFLGTLGICLCVVGGPSRANADPPPYVDPEYNRLFSLDGDNQIRDEAMLTLEIGGMLGVNTGTGSSSSGGELEQGQESTSLKYNAYALTRFVYFMGMGVGVYGSQDEEPQMEFLLPFYLLEINKHLFYIPVSFREEGTVWGAGYSYPFSQSADLRVELTNFVDNEPTVRAGLNYRIF